ncbi:GntR family transcriptional regulator [Paenibacillus sp. UNC499MF]|uniref:GntR family transcriptional regulator n=1 Tax=Paenibacillus sp. UNC499MF TaxID=1502751 RepID=UPI00089FE13E|nr:GntR family transcriptional regulator [Paenibacillus sp. UNC499MF]SEG51512.1 DNA-binding transcriptional regulator YhcF, GntR family [Paenibacillus sp. UNC499MF]
MHIPIQISPDNPEPLYHQIQVQLKELILSGHLPEGTLLPSIREFAKDLSCSVITIRRVYQDLENEGILRTRQGTGTFVAKVGTTVREQYRKEAVVEAMKDALRSGLRVGCTIEELKQLFEEALAEITSEGKLVQGAYEPDSNLGGIAKRDTIHTENTTENTKAAALLKPDAEPGEGGNANE